MKSPEDHRMHHARALFEAQVDAVDGATATALRARRREALASAPPHRRSPWWWPASGVATAALAVVLWLPRTDGPNPPSAGRPAADDFAASAPATPPATDPETTAPVEAGAAEAARFADAALVELDDDAEFYAWLATVPDDTGATDDPLALPDTGPHEGLTL